MKRLKAGYGYWDTTYYPIGGSFHRVGENGIVIVKVLRSFERYKGVNEEGLTEDNRKVCYDSSHTEE